MVAWALNSSNPISADLASGLTLEELPLFQIHLALSVDIPVQKERRCFLLQGLCASAG
jgi:hypothetical protein